MKIFKTMIFTILCVVVFITSMIAGAIYNDVCETRSIEIETCTYDNKIGKYLIKENIVDGFGRIIDENVYYSEEGL